MEEMEQLTQMLTSGIIPAKFQLKSQSGEKEGANNEEEDDDDEYEEAHDDASQSQQAMQH
jgi:hypothetical protein